LEGDRDNFVAFLSSDTLSNRKSDRTTKNEKDAPCKREEEVQLVFQEDLKHNQGSNCLKTMI
jgi:hypothetical protein